jgi:hypothetical protein
MVSSVEGSVYRSTCPALLYDNDMHKQECDATNPFIYRGKCISKQCFTNTLSRISKDPLLEFTTDKELIR